MKVIFKVYIFSRIFKKRELSENVYSAKVSTFTVYNLLADRGIPEKSVSIPSPPFLKV